MTGSCRPLGRLSGTTAASAAPRRCLASGMTNVPKKASTARRRDRFRPLAGNPGQGGSARGPEDVPGVLQPQGGVVASDALSEEGPLVRNSSSGFLFTGLVPLLPANLDHFVAAGSTLPLSVKLRIMVFLLCPTANVTECVSNLSINGPVLPHGAEAVPSVASAGSARGRPQGSLLPSLEVSLRKLQNSYFEKQFHDPSPVSGVWGLTGAPASIPLRAEALKIPRESLPHENLQIVYIFEKSGE
jgi:hypothetical protein